MIQNNGLFTQRRKGMGAKEIRMLVAGASQYCADALKRAEVRNLFRRFSLTTGIRGDQ